MLGFRPSVAGKTLPMHASPGLVAAIVAGLGLFALPAQASHATSRPVSHEAAKPAKVGSTAVAAKDPDTTGSLRADDLASNCSRSRKKLWVEDEGWIVRQVTTCY